MSRFRWLVPNAIACCLVAGCMHIDSTGQDSTPPDAPLPPGTSLDGTIRCGDMQCPSGTLCIHWSAGIDAGVPGNTAACSTVPMGCRVSDCSVSSGNVCPSCILELCSSATQYYVDLVGRDLYCPGV